MALRNKIEQVKKFEVRNEILGANPQTAHKIIQLTIRTKIRLQKEKMKKQKRFRHLAGKD